MKALILFLLLDIVFLFGCHPAVQNPVKIEDTTKEDIKGVFTLLLYGASHANDIETVAILDIEGDRFTIKPDAPEYYYTTRKNVPALEALDEATAFVSRHRAFHRVQISRIIDGKGAVLGYEIRPFYDPMAYGLFDVLDIKYTLDNSTVKADIRLIYIIERRLLNDNGDFKMFRW